MSLFWELPGLIQIILGLIAFSLGVQLIVALAQVALNLVGFIIGLIITLPFVVLFLIGLVLYEYTLGRFFKSSNSEHSENYSKNHYKDENENSNSYQDSSESGENQKPDTVDKAQCPYKVLGIERDASKSQIRTAYRKKLLSNHPDRVQDMDPELIKIASDRIIAINEAYQRLAP